MSVRGKTRWQTWPFDGLALSLWLVVVSAVAGCGGDSTADFSSLVGDAAIQQDSMTIDAEAKPDTGTITPEAGKETGSEAAADAAFEAAIDGGEDTGTVVPDGGETDSGTVTPDGGEVDTGTVTPDAAGDAEQDTGVEIDAGPPPTLSIDDILVVEGNTGTTTATFTVTLSAPASQVVTVDYATADGTASALNAGVGGSDYSAVKGTLAFDPGDTTKTISVSVNGDTTYESDEAFSVGLVNPANATILKASGAGTIQNDDAPPTLSIDNVTLSEGNSGTTIATFKVLLSAPSARTATVDFATADGTATVGPAVLPMVGDADYVAASGTLTFLAGETSKTVDVSVNADTLMEADETFFVNLANPGEASIPAGQDKGTGTITNDDGGLPTITITGPADAAEGQSGTNTRTFKVSVSGYHANDITVDFATKDGNATAGGLQAAGGMDYVPSSGTLTFSPSDTTKDVVVTVNGDTVFEGNETFNVVLSNATNGQIDTGSATATIVNDDTLPTLTINDVSLKEGAAGMQSATFTITLSSTTSQTVSVGYATADGAGPDPATAGGDASKGGLDYSAASGTVNFAPGSMTQSVTVFVNGDLLNEADEDFLVKLSAPVNAALGAKSQGIGKIVNDDPLPVIAISDAKIVEGNSGVKDLAFVVNASAPSGRLISFDYASADGVGVSPATVADGDYVATSGSAALQPSQTALTIVVKVNGDTKLEESETFRVTLSQPVNAQFSGGAATVTAIGAILNDDTPLLQISFASLTVSASESTSNTTPLSFAVQLSSPVPAGDTVTVDYQTGAAAPFPATPDVDYKSAKGTLTFSQGEQVKTVLVHPIDDTLDEENERLSLNLSNASASAAIVTPQAEGIIIDDDASPTVTIVYNGLKTLLEGTSGSSTQAQFVASLSAVSGRAVQVSYATADGTAQSGGNLVSGGQDYVATSGTLTFAPGEWTHAFQVIVNGDGTWEPDETFSASLANPVNAVVGAPGTAIATILNDDAAPAISIADASILEGTPPPGGTLLTPLVFTVKLTNPSSQAVTVTAQTPAASICPGPLACATPGVDFLALSPTVLTFQPGVTAVSVSVLIRGDFAKEPDEVFWTNLSNAKNATILVQSAVGTIVNDD